MYERKSLQRNQCTVHREGTFKKASHGNSLSDCACVSGGFC
jgi:hypothetical protein